jgi:tryptophanyl-tRNA synthetase
MKPRPGIKTTGMPHSATAGRHSPALELTREYRTFYFIADYHALNSIRDRAEMERNCYEVAAAWLACGLDPEHSFLYRQSQVPETFELSTMLMCFTAKGLMNRAHAYKAMLQANEEAGRDPDDGVNMGLFTYPVLMAADILLLMPTWCPWARIRRSTSRYAGHCAGAQLRVRQTVAKGAATAHPRGNTNRHRSGRPQDEQSYGNTIPLFLPENQLRKLLMRVVTNSQTMEEPKDPDQCNVFALYRCLPRQTSNRRWPRATARGAWVTARPSSSSLR